MKTVFESLDVTTRKSIQLCIENIESISRSSSKLREVGVDENTLVISSDNAAELIKKIPLIVAHQTIIRKLKIRPLSDPYEVDHFEDRKHWPKNISQYLKQFKANPFDTNVIFQIAIEKSMPLKKVARGSRKFVLTGAFNNDPLLNRTIGLATRDVWGYNTFSGLFHDVKIIERMAKLDTAFNLKHLKSIIPVRVFSDFVDIKDSVEIITSIRESSIGGPGVLLHGVDRDLEELQDELEDVVCQFVEKYPILEGNTPTDFGSRLLNYYTMPPKKMIRRFGPNIICCPFEVPEALRSTNYVSNCGVKPIQYDSFGHHPLIC
jgi:hypothetical protein